VARSDFGQEQFAKLGHSVTLQTRLIVAGTGNLPEPPVLNPARQVAFDGERPERGISGLGSGLNAPFNGVEKLAGLGLLSKVNLVGEYFRVPSASL
jgi:hypothetical protein